jgi:uncharacterized protein (DUF983 family)
MSTGSAWLLLAECPAEFASFGGAGLRPLKGWLVCSQFFHKVEEGKIDHDYRRNGGSQGGTP